MKLAYLFSGQGSQFAQMGMDLYRTNATYRATIDEAATALQVDLTEPTVWDDPAQVQVVILAMSYAIYRQLTTQLPAPVAAVGLSLGEYSALVASGALDFAAALRLVRDRSQYMATAGKQHPGKLAAVLKLNPQRVTELCDDYAGVYPANYNTARQTVIGGTSEAVTAIQPQLLAAGAKRVVPLAVAVASHTPLMESASKALFKRLQAERFAAPAFPVISNTTNRPFTVEQLPTTLASQLVKPTHFQQNLLQLVQDYHVDTVVELGPGTTLSKFAKQTVPNLVTYHVDTVETLQQVQAALQVRSE
ncbi:ACP S-malonyltransferase [Fructilactobacillus florum]|uniref:ACP S-malonyltransferase n=1 Tax=Fructilactobacillus florum TaxID=640331 RepID=UPI0002E2622E|nr:ACP S-malonyltransferase [Fructilactobacillus florum]